MLRQVDSSRLLWPAAQDIASQDGGFGNREYQDLRGCTWNDVKAALEIEEKFLARPAGLYPEDDFDEDQEWESLVGLDVGIASSVMALSAARCVPIASCNGMPGHHESCPIVAFYCRQPRVPDLMAVAEEVNCGLENGREGSLIVYANTVQTMMEFARRLMARRNKLARLRAAKDSAQSLGIGKASAQQLRLALAE